MASGSGTMFASSLAGVLDCPTGKLSRFLSHIRRFGDGSSASSPAAGEFSATYERKAGHRRSSTA